MSTDEFAVMDCFEGAESRIAEIAGGTFEPLVSTHMGIVITKSSPFASRESVNPMELRHVPVPLNTHRELTRVIDDVFSETPLENKLFGFSAMRPSIENLYTSPHSVAIFNSLALHLGRLDPMMSTQGLVFVPPPNLP